MRRRDTVKKGFTLVEVIVVLVVLVLLAGLSYGAVKGLVSRAEQNSRDQVARSLFMAAQSALTHVYANDPALASQYAAMTEINLGRIEPPIADHEQTIVSLTSNGGAGAQAQMLTSLLSPYVDDQSVLGDNIVIEYNRLTGNVLACFYSDVTELAHGGAYDVYDRTESSLKKASVGYFGVSSTGKRAVRVPVDEQVEPDAMDVILVDYDDPDVKQGNDINGGNNYGLLTLELSMPTNVPLESTGNDYVVYTIMIHSKNPESGTALNSFTLTIGNDPASLPAPQIALSEISIGLSGPLSLSLKPYQDAEGEQRNAAVFIDPRRDASGRQVLVLVLDSLEADCGIKALYPEIASGNLIASVEAAYYSASSIGGEPQVVDALAPNSEHALYAYVERQTDVGGSDYKYGVASLRHLNNVRETLDGRFVQTRNIPMIDHTGASYAMPPIGAGSDEFSGIYDGNDKKISGLRMNGINRAGLFDRNRGSITHVYLYNAELEGTALAGGIAAKNNGGHITNCTVYHEASASNISGYFINATGAGGVAGGIAAENRGTIEGCYVGTGVKATDIAGGVVGLQESDGTVRECEVATAMASAVSGVPGNLVGNPKYGAFSGQYDYGEQPGIYAIDIGQRWIHASNKSPQRANGLNHMYIVGVAGGIVGLQRGGAVAYCVNAAHVEAYGSAGGVVGSMYGDTSTTRSELEQSYNAGWVRCADVAGGVVGSMHNADIRYCYNASSVNCRLSNIATQYSRLPVGPSARYLPVEITQNAEVAGGIVGAIHANSTVEYCYSAGYVCAAGHTAHAGAFGRVGRANNDTIKLRSCYFLRNCLNVSERFYFFNDTWPGPIPHNLDNNESCVTMLEETEMEQLIRGGGSIRDYLIDAGGHLCVYTDNHSDPDPIGAGPSFRRNDAMNTHRQYWFPVLRVADWLKAGSDFHRTPYYPLAERFGEIKLEESGGSYILTAYVPDDTAVTLRLWMSDATGSYASFDYNAPAVPSGGDVVFGGAVQGYLVVEVLSVDNPFHAFGCRKKYTITIQKTDPAFLSDYSDFHAQMLGPSNMVGPAGNTPWGNCIWGET